MMIKDGELVITQNRNAFLILKFYATRNLNFVFLKDLGFKQFCTYNKMIPKFYDL